jgi:general secretion pathway protein N
MVGRSIFQPLAVCIAAISGSAFALAATSPLATIPLESAAERSAPDIVPEPSWPARQASRERLPTGNPLWAVPLRSLSSTRERPLFSPSRRPPPPAVVAAPQVVPTVLPPKPAEPERPLLVLVGTIVGDSGGIGVFLDASTKNVVRLRTGQDHDGWVLRAVRGRDAIFAKDKRSATLSLPAPGEQSAQLPPTAAPASGTWMDGDGQLIAPPPKNPLQGRFPISTAGDNL